jgi:bacillithiol biosynthesis cysteine-adding enzyme BshC
VTLRIVDTPLEFTPEWPSARTGGFDPALLEAIVPAEGSAPLLEKLKRPDVLVVTTGQQPALFTGPLYTIHKALSARALAAHLEARWQRPVVPIFWSAGDDHDFAEARTTNWLRRDGTVGAFSLPARAPDAPQLPMYRTKLSAEVTSLLGALEEDIGGLQHGPWAVEWLRRHWAPGRNLGESFNSSLAELFAPLGVLTFDPTHRSAKRAMAGLLIKAVGLARDLDRDLAERDRELRASGTEGGVVVGDGATLVMIEGRLGRDRLVIQGDHFATRRSEEPFTMAALQQIAAAEPERLSANVLLRPVIEAAILPTVAYLGGPGELRYWQLTPPIYGRMRITPQAAMPRWSGLIIPPHVERLLSSLGTSLDELLAPGSQLENRLARQQVPTAAADALAHLLASVVRDFEVMRQSGGTIAPQLARSLEGLQRKMEWLGQKADAKILSHLKRKEEERMGQIRRARGALLPSGRPQERVFTVAPFLAQYGPGVLAEVAQAALSWYGSALVGGKTTP